MRRRLTAVTYHFLPELRQATLEMQSAALGSVLGTLYGVPLALAGIIWLLWVTDWAMFAAQWPLLLLLFALHRLLGYFDFSTVLASDSVRVHGSQARLVTWSAALLLGPGALWLDLLGALIDALLRPLPSTSTPLVARVQRWDRVRVFSVTVGRETLSLLPALWLYGRLGGLVPLAALSLEAVAPALWATLLKSGLFALIIAPLLLLFLLATEHASLIEQLRTFYHFWLAVIVFYLLPEPFGVLAAGLYAAGGLWVYLFFFVGIGLFSFLIHQLVRTALTHQRRARELVTLERLAQIVLKQPAPELDLSDLLKQHLPGLLPFVWVEIRLFPADTIYRSDWVGLPPETDTATAMQPSLADSVWQQMAESREPYLLLRQFDAQEKRDGLLVPIFDTPDEGVIGGLCALPHANDGDVLDFLPALRSLAALIAAVQYQKAQYEAALAVQAKAYQEELYAQAYQAELYAQALEYQKMAQELAVAGQIQASFLPQSLPDVPGWQFAVTLEPARETSGDFYDIIPLRNGRIGLLVADVADKGIGPALYMALSRTLIRTYADAYEQQPDQVLAATNRRILTETVNDLFVTVFYAELEPETGMLVYCNAGHNPPFLLQSGNGRTAHPLGRTAIPLGILEEVNWQHNMVTIMPGDVLVMYTDGVTEAQDEMEEFFGEERLQQVVRTYMHRSADVIEDKVVSAIYEFVGDAPQFDDITLMVLQRENGQ
ncbi:MAG: PP2C family protein-serine/threonine phosphatase [Ardenticatenaceae bacterium]|nr:PP2C family protein-serine/threonine phosphatase [Ardenticatenaceae bacterium]